MTTQQVAEKLVQFCSKGDWEKAVQELYAEQVSSIEMPGTPFPERTNGLEAMKVKGEQWQSMIETVHDIKIEGPIVAGKFFSCTMISDVTMKGGPRSTNAEVCVYQVDDGKIISEQFFY